MQIEYLGHACFLITGSEGTKLVTDPYESGGYDGAVGYSPQQVSAELVLVSHAHPDHSFVSAVSGRPRVIDRAGSHEIGPLSIKGLATFHDGSRGRERGANLVFAVEIDRLHLVHLGDLGHELGPTEKQALGPVDVLLVPVGGYYSIDARQASKVVEFLGPRVVIPMHFKTPVLSFPIAPVEEFTRTQKAVKRPGSLVVLTAEELPRERECWVLTPSR